MEIKGERFMLIVLGFMSMAALTGASDPDILSDFLIPNNQSVPLDGKFFTYTGLREIDGNLTGATTVRVIKVSKAEFPALEGLAVSYAVLLFPAGGVNPPHTHPRASELLLVLDGSLDVGFVDTTGKLFTQTLQAADVFVFPKGLLHFQQTTYNDSEAVAISAFGSASAGTVSMPSTLFGSCISDVVLAKSFKTDVKTIESLKAGFKP